MRGEMRALTPVSDIAMFGEWRQLMRSPVLFLVIALGLALWMLSSFLTIGSSNMPTLGDRLVVGLWAVSLLLLIALVLAIVIARRGRAPLPTPAIVTVVIGLLAGLLWAFAVGMASG
jgi:hypothetical protein